MAASALLRVIRRPPPPGPSVRYVAAVHHRLILESKYTSVRHFSIFKEFSKQLEGEAKSNPEFQQSVKRLNEKIGVVREGLQVRTKKTMENLYHSVDDIWKEAEAASKKVSTIVKEKLSAAKEEVKESLGLRKEKASGSTCTYSSIKHGNDTASKVGSTQHFDVDNRRGLHSLFNRFRTISSPNIVSLALKKLKEGKVSEIAQKGYSVVKDELSSHPTKKKYIDYEPIPTSSGVKSSRTDIVIVHSEQSFFGKMWEECKTKAEPVINSMRGISQPVKELVEDVRDRLDTSDHPIVMKIQDVKESITGETLTALSTKEIHRRDPSFYLPDLIAEVQELISPVLTAYSKGDLKTLMKYCGREVLERCRAEKMGYESQGIFSDNKILHISEVDVMETTMFESSPAIVLKFQTQQIHCERDRQGSITAGGKDTIQTVSYAWFMQLMDPDELGEEEFRPLWRLRSMERFGVQALI